MLPSPARGRWSAAWLLRALLAPMLIFAALALPAAASASGLLLDGVDDYVEAGVDPTALDTTTARTWEAWVKTDSAAQIAVISHYRQTGDQPWVIDMNGGIVRLFISGASFYSASTVNDGEWHHIAAVWEPGTRVGLYIDGELDANHTSGVPGAKYSGASISMRIGAYDYQGNIYGEFDGELDGIRYSHTARYTSDFTPGECPVVDEDTIALWNFEEGSGTTTAPEGQHEEAAELLNGTGWGDGFECSGGGGGDAGDALRFDGENDRLDAGDDPTAADNDSARTWEAWVKTTNLDYQAIIGRFDADGDVAWVLDMEDGVPRIHVRDGGDRGARYGATGISDGEWHHVAAVWVPGDRLDLYVDGELSNGALGSGGVPDTIAVGDDTPIRIGVGNDDGDLEGFFAGDMDGVRYSEGARYSGSFEPIHCWTVDGDTIAQWNFDEGQGTRTEPAGQLSEDADLVGGVDWIAGEACETPSGGSALLLDGVDDYVEAGLDPTALDNTTARTWEAWVKTESSAQIAVFTHYRQIGGEQPWVIDMTGGVVRMFLSGSSFFSTSTVNDGEWHHIAVVWQPGARLDIYVDGELDSANTSGVPSAMDTAAGYSMRIGAYDYQGSIFGEFDGALDGIHYSHTARYDPTDPPFTPDPTPTADGDTIALWTFSEGSGTTTAPDGLHTTPATLLNGTGWTFGPPEA